MHMAVVQPPDYIRHLSRDKKLLSLLKAQPFRLKKERNVCLQLCSSIMSQQLSTKVAAVIYRRFLDLFAGEAPSPEQILSVPVETLRGIGLSGAKTQYVRNVAQYAADHGMEDKKLYRMSNDEVMSFLTPIKGVGRWTVEMLLIFTLAREDVFAPDDLGIQQAMARLYKLDHTDKKPFREQLLKISGRWAPYRSYACLHLWRFKDQV
jgi:DNA-3-methyladenine glycosylase II